MKYLLDTNVIIGFFKGDTELVRRMESLSALHISVITRGELLFGALNSSNSDRNRATYLEFFQFCDIINISEKTADYYAEIRHALKSKGQPIPENDIWIAASAKEHDMVIITRDRHLLELNLIPSEEW